MFTRVLVLAGQPALTATASACACSVALAPLAVVLVDVLALGVLFPLETAMAIPTMAPATTTTRIRLRICRRRFVRLASAASRASLAARWRALLSLGTARDPTQSGDRPRIAPRARRHAPGARAPAVPRSAITPVRSL